MADQLTNTTTNTAIVPEIWSQKFYDVLVAKLPFIDSVSRDYEGEISAMGDNINISSIPEFDTATLLGEGSKGDSESVTIATQQLTINSRAYKDVVITKRAQLQSLPFMDGLRDKMIYSIMKKMQADIISAIVPSASSPDNTISYTTGSTLALADILKAKELLDEQNVPEGGRILVCGSAQTNDIFSITGFISRDYIPSGTPLSSGKIETPLAGFTHKMTTVASTTSYLFHPSFMALAIQDSLNIEVFNLGVSGIRGSRVNADVLYGIKQLDNKRVVTIS